jgi:hypothetical protein
VCVVTRVNWQYGHFSSAARNSFWRCVEFPRFAINAMQWCFPARRQHTGTRAAFVVLNANSGETTGKPKTNSIRMESGLGNSCIESPNYVRRQEIHSVRAERLTKRREGEHSIERAQTAANRESVGDCRCGRHADRPQPTFPSSLTEILQPYWHTTAVRC